MYLFCLLSSYSKSSILDLAETMVEAAALYFPESTIRGASKEQANEGTLTNECHSSTTTVNIPVNQSSVKIIHDKVVFNDGTAAGVLSSLMDRTRTMHLHEADVTLKSLGLVLPSPLDTTPSRIDPFRSTLMTLHEKPDNFLRVLKKERIHITGSKCNIFVCCLSFFLINVCLEIFS